MITAQEWARLCVLSDIKEGIRKALSKPEGDLTQEDLEQLTSLELEKNQITDLTPLKDLTQLEELTYHNNQVSNAQIKELKKKLPNMNSTPWWKFW